MNLQDKISFLQNAMNLSDHDFCVRYQIRSSLFKKFKNKEAQLSKDNVKLLCIEIGLDLEDFCNDSSTLNKEPREGEHICKFSPKVVESETILEDFAREDNSRYEEKD